MLEPEQRRHKRRFTLLAWGNGCIMILAGLAFALFIIAAIVFGYVFVVQG